MRDLNEARSLLQELGMPPKLYNDMSVYTLIAMTDMADRDSWSEATNEYIGINEIIRYLDEKGLRSYAPNTRESIRKHVIKPWRDLALVEDNGEATNSGNMKYRIKDEILGTIRTFGTDEWRIALHYFQVYHPALVRGQAAERTVLNMNVRINGFDYQLSTGAHNRLQKAVAEVFKEQFARNSEFIYLGDSTDRELYKNRELLADLGFDITLDILPDIVLYDREKKWLYFIECVTSVGPVSEQRKADIEAMTVGVDAGNIYITAFPDLATFKKFAGDLAWETEVWIADMPTHMIHLNGDRFIGPRI